MAVSFADREFLLWLYWRIAESGHFDLDDYGLEPVEISVEGNITLSALGEDGFSYSIRAPHLSDNEEVLAGVRNRRIPESMKLRVIQGRFEWYFSLQSHPLAIKSVKLPIAAEKEETDIIQFRIESISMLEHIMKALISLFLLEWTDDTVMANLKRFLVDRP